MVGSRGWFERSHPKMGYPCWAAWSESRRDRTIPLSLQIQAPSKKRRSGTGTSVGRASSTLVWGAWGRETGRGWEEEGRVRPGELRLRPNPSVRGRPRWARLRRRGARAERDKGRRRKRKNKKKTDNRPHPSVAKQKIGISSLFRQTKNSHLATIINPETALSPFQHFFLSRVGRPEPSETLPSRRFALWLMAGVNYDKAYPTTCSQKRILIQAIDRHSWLAYGRPNYCSLSLKLKFVLGN